MANFYRKVIAVAMVIVGGIMLLASGIVLIAQVLSDSPIWLIWLVGICGVVAFIAGMWLLLTKHIYTAKKNHKTDNASNPERDGIHRHAK
jgi:hypothetical protein